MKSNFYITSYYFLLFVILQGKKISATSWKPLVTDSYHNFYQSIVQTQHDYEQLPSHQCALYKVILSQQEYRQYVSYRHEITALKEFTLCMWMKFHNHSNDHPLFSYSVDGQPKAILSWVSNTAQSSFVSLAIDGHTFYRLNYPFKVFKWYHSCQSWNGHTGEWQLWVNGERVGRGFHNRLVGHKIRPGGIAISGQEKPPVFATDVFQSYNNHTKQQTGMQGELTMLQMYSVALTAGKAHYDHKHHHVHLFDHNGLPITTSVAPVTTQKPIMQSHPLITGNQLNPMLQLNLGLTPIQTSFIDLNNYQLSNLQKLNPIIFTSHRLNKRNDIKEKRDLYYDTVNGHFLNYNVPGLALIAENEKILNEQKEPNIEPAELEVAAIMRICTGCDREPFQKALIIDWRSIAKKLYFGSMYTLTNPQCKGL